MPPLISIQQIYFLVKSEMVSAICALASCPNKSPRPLLNTIDVVNEEVEE